MRIRDWSSDVCSSDLWDSRTRATRSRPSLPTILDAGLHMRWFASTLLTHGLPVFRNVIHFVPKEQRGFFESAFWIRDQMPRTLSWDTVAKIRERWGKPFFLKGILNLDRSEEHTSELQSLMRISHAVFC